MLSQLAVLLLTVTVVRPQSEEEIQYYVDLISAANENVATYQFPRNLEAFSAEGPVQKYGSYDFIVVGLGAAGSVAASRLSEVKKWSVLGLEAGHSGNNFSAIPNMYFPIQFTDFNWAYNSTPQKTCCLGMENDVCFLPRGRGIGGTTLINGLVYARGHKSDFDLWGELTANKRWSYPSVLKYFKKSENFVHRDPDAPYDPKYHSEGGYLRVEYHLPRSPQLNAFLDANRELGLGVVDYNANKLGASPSQLNTINGRRLDDGNAFLRPVRNRKNLEILSGSYVTKIRINKKTRRACGVEFNRNGVKYFVEARKEVIVSGGAYATPQILMLSGLGPRRHLEPLGIEVIKDLEVGSALRNNPTFYGMIFNTNYTEEILPLREYVKQYLNGRGQLAIPGSNQGVGFYESSYTLGTGVPDIEIMMIPSNATSPFSQRSFGITDQTYQDLWEHTNPPQTFIMYIVDLHSESRGTVRLRSNNPYEYPLINVKWLSDPGNRDIQTIYEGIQLSLRLIETESFKAMNATLASRPLRACKQHKFLSKDYWYCAIREVTADLYHPQGSCPMGTDPYKGAVVDSELKVFGIKNLRIADASVFPSIPAGHPNAPSVMVGEQLGDIVKEAHGIET